MADLSAVLANVKFEEATVDYDNYVDQSEFPPPAPEGVYTLKLVEANFEAKDGNLIAILTHQIVDPGGANDGHKITFDRVSSKTFERNGVKVSTMIDMIRALGNRERPRSAEDLANAIKAGIDQTWKGQTQWEAGCNHKDTEHEVEWGNDGVFRLKGMKKFPLLPDGSHAAEVTCSTCEQSVRARERVSRRIPA